MALQRRKSRGKRIYKHRYKITDPYKMGVKSKRSRTKLKVPDSIKRSIPFIRILALSKNKANKGKLLASFPNYVTNDIIEIIYNIATGKVPIKPYTRNRLAKHTNKIDRLINLSNKKMRRTYLHKQKGGFLGMVLPIIASLVGGVVSGLT